VVTLPDILVLGGGGRQGDSWMTGILAGIEDGHDLSFADCDYLVGTSAGAIIAAKLAVGRRLQRPAERVAAASGEQSPLPNWAGRSAMAIASPFALLGVRLGTRPGELLRSAVLRAVPTSATGALDFHGAFPPSSARFDGRLRVVAVERLTGKRVVFGAPGAPQATVEQALTASCALPLVFSPAVIAGREYVDGATWSPTNADVAPATREAQVLILAPMASLHGPFHQGVRALSRAAMLLEAAALKARGARVDMISPDRGSAAAIGRDLMADAHRDETHGAGYQQGLAL
jgi:NTE family protein